MTAPPGRAPHPKPTGGLVSANAADQAAAAIKRAGFTPTPGRIRMVLRAQRATGETPSTEFDWWDRLIRSMPHGLSRPRAVARREWAVTSS